MNNFISFLHQCKYSIMLIILYNFNGCFNQYFYIFIVVYLEWENWGNNNGLEKLCNLKIETFYASKQDINSAEKSLNQTNRQNKHQKSS